MHRLLRDPSLIIAALALIVSIWTQIESFLRSNAQLDAQQRDEISRIMSRFAEIPVERAEVLLRFQEAELDTEIAASAFDGEIRSLANRAAEIIINIPELISPLEKLMVVQAMMEGSAYNAALPVLVDAHQHVRDPFESVIVSRTLGQLHFLRGDLESGRRYYEAALTQVVDPELKFMTARDAKFTDALTKLYWAEQEAFADQCVRWADLLQSAKDEVPPELARLEAISGPVGRLERFGCPPTRR